MFEAGFDKLCDKVCCVYTSKEAQITRLINRDNIDREDAIKKINAQMDVELKKQKSDYLIESCPDFNDTIKNIDIFLERIK
jgi:dephospho-CoA kinase